MSFCIHSTKFAQTINMLLIHCELFLNYDTFSLLQESKLCFSHSNGSEFWYSDMMKTNLQVINTKANSIQLSLSRFYEDIVNDFFVRILSLCN